MTALAKSRRPLICDAQEIETLIKGTPCSLLRAPTKRGACPLGAPGDKLWVREAYAHILLMGVYEMVAFAAGDNRSDYGGPWCSPVGMSKAFSRLNLTVVSVRSVALADLTETDATNLGYRAGKEGSALQTLLTGTKGLKYAASRAPELFIVEVTVD